ncbi:Type-1 restriction enzyme EcoKI specificity protein [Phytobacter ursingii]|nr:Type-1 restriction enzyme EcoKI specificity protein [Phytobacter ursingii]
MSEVKLPEGWVKTSYGDLLLSASNGVGGVQNKSGLGIPVSRIETIANGEVDFSRVGFLEHYDVEKIAKHKLNSGDILFSHINSPTHLGKTALFTENVHELYHGINLLRIVVNRELILPEIFNYHCKYSRAIGVFSLNAQHAVNQSSLNQKKLFSFVCNLPTIVEQKIIADKLDILLAQVDSTKVRLEQIPQILKRFRQAVLAAAVSGKMTKKWRKKNKISSDWKSIQFLELITKLRSGSGDTPSDNAFGVPILRSSAIRPQTINYEDVRYLSDEENLNEDNYLKNGDLLFTRLSGSVDYVGSCALVKGLTKKYQYPDRLFCARLKDQRNANYLEYFCSSNIFREHIIKSIKSSAGHQRITLDAIRTAQIFIPDYLEQTEIVRRLEQLFAYADGIEKQVQNALERVNNLTQSILTKAFLGELTAQWRAENPDLISGENSAQALLAKIQQQRKNTKTIKRSKGNS